MKALLMHRARDFDLQQELPDNEDILRQDLELETLFNAMASGDELLFDVARKAVLTGFDNDVDTILHRQAILTDCLNNPQVARELYALAVEAIESRKRHWLGVFGNYPGATLANAVSTLQMFMGILKKLRDIIQQNENRFDSDGFRALSVTVQEELSDEYLASVRAYLDELRFGAGVLISAELGSGNEGAHYMLRKPRRNRKDWLKRMLGRGEPVYTFRIPPRDEAGGRALSELRNRGINLVANALAQSSDHVLGFFRAMRVELSFYVGCLNLYDRLGSMGVPVCLPRPVLMGERRLEFIELRDVCLTLDMGRKVVGNSANANGKSILIITGANRGGKSSFLRGVGVAQLMMQCGMFVAAESFAAALCPGLFTHYKREEDPAMKSGKFDEELARMSEIVDRIEPDSLLLLNESFAATNEREGAEIARQIVRALLERRMKILYVTHLYEFAHGFFDKSMEEAMFLRAERRDDGTRTFKLIEGEPLETSYGEDLYEKVFGRFPFRGRTDTVEDVGDNRI